MLLSHIAMDIISDLAHIRSPAGYPVRVICHRIARLDNHLFAELLREPLCTRTGLTVFVRADKRTPAPVVEPQQALSSPPGHFTWRLSGRTLRRVYLGLSLLLCLALRGGYAGRPPVRRNHSTARSNSTMVLLCCLPQRGLLSLGGRCLSRRRCGCVLLGDDWYLDGLGLGDILFRLLVFDAPFSQLLNKCFCFAWKSERTDVRRCNCWGV